MTRDYKKKTMSHGSQSMLRTWRLSFNNPWVIQRKYGRKMLWLLILRKFRQKIEWHPNRHHASRIWPTRSSSSWKAKVTWRVLVLKSRVFFPAGLAYAHMVGISSTAKNFPMNPSATTQMVTIPKGSCHQVNELNMQPRRPWTT